MKSTLLLLLALASDCWLNAQPVQASLKELLIIAEKNYPLIKAKKLDVQAAQKGLDAARRTLVPSMDLAYQVNYATHNNITGMVYPQFLLPISGPPSASNNMEGVFGSAGGLLVNWQPVTFGQRAALTDYAKAGIQFAHEDANNELFKHKINVINAYLDVMMAMVLVRLGEENLRRIQAYRSEIAMLVVSGIKPGVDSALTEAEVSRAEVDLLNTRNQERQTRILLSNLLASDSVRLFNDTSYFYRLPTSFILNDTLRNPLLSVYVSNIGLGYAKKKVLSRTTLPTLGMWGTAYARGSGVASNGMIKSTEGLGLQRYNYGLGVQLSIPLLQYARIKPQIDQQTILVKSGEERLNEVTLQLRKQLELADTALSNALSIAKLTPRYFESAAFSYRALLSRYQSGLANFSDLMQAEYGLAKAETENKTAYMRVWKTLLFKAAVSGDLNLFLNQVN
jgi:outer membrane protein TolC